MELIQIRYFVAAAHFQNLSKAAQIMNISQPALSKSISKLEAELGVQLFDRFGKKVALNEHGEKFLENTASLLQRLDDVVSNVKYQESSNPSLCIGMFHHSDRFMQCFKEFLQIYKNITYQIEYMNAATDDIDTNIFDMILYPKTPSFRKYRGDRIYSDPYSLAVSKVNSLAREKAVRLSDLAAQKLIFIRHDEAIYDFPYHMCAGTGVQISDCIFTNSYEIHRWLIHNDCGAGFVPQSSANAYIQTTDIVLLPVIDEGFSQDIIIGFKKEKNQSDIGKIFTTFVCEYFGIIPETRHGRT